MKRSPQRFDEDVAEIEFTTIHQDFNLSIGLGGERGGPDELRSLIGVHYLGLSERKGAGNIPHKPETLQLWCRSAIAIKYTVFAFAANGGFPPKETAVALALKLPLICASPRATTPPSGVFVRFDSG